VQCMDSPLPLRFLDAIPLHEVLSSSWGFDAFIFSADALTLHTLSIKDAIEERLGVVEAAQDTEDSVHLPPFCNSDSALQDCQVSCTTSRRRRGWNRLHLGLQMFLYVVFAVVGLFALVLLVRMCSGIFCPPEKQFEVR
jgi:hypothetical protein